MQAAEHSVGTRRFFSSNVNPWTPERVEELKRLIGEGLSSGRIAKAMGGPITRNAVIGKAGRLGLKFGPPERGGEAPPKPRSAEVDAVLGLWQRGFSSVEIREETGVPGRRISHIVQDARRRGDPRALRRKTPHARKAPSSDIHRRAGLAPDWTPQMDARLAALWRDGDLSTAQAAEAMTREFARPLTANAVRGRAEKLRNRGYDLPLREGSLAARRAEAEAIAERQRLAPRRPAMPAVSIGDPAPDEPDPDFAPIPAQFDPPPEGGGIPFIARRSGQCAWIEGEPSASAIVCGAPVVRRIGSTSSYCAHHHARCFVPAPAANVRRYQSAGWSR